MIILLFDRNRVFFFSVINIDHSGLHLFIFDKFVFWEITYEITIGASLHLSSPLMAFRVKCCWIVAFSDWLLNPEYSWGYFHFTASKSDFLFYCYKVSGSLYLAVKIEVGRAAVQDSAGSNVNRNKSKQKELSQLNLSQCYDEFDQKEK